MTALTNYTIDQISNYLTHGYWDYRSVYYHSFNVGSSGTGANDGRIYYVYDELKGVDGAADDLDGLSNHHRALVDHAFQYLEEILGLEFVRALEAVPNVDIYFTDVESGAYAVANFHLSGNGQTDHRYTDVAWVNIDPGWNGGDTDINGYTYQTIVHEIMHTLGLGHPGPYNADGSPDYEPVYVTDSNDAAADRSNVALNDSWQQTIMSYFDQDMNTVVNADFAYVLTPMAADIEALRSFYGSSAFVENTIYGFNTSINQGRSAVLNALADYADEAAFCIVDDGGNDTVDFSGFGADQTIDLTVVTGTSTGIFSNIGGLIGNMSLAVGTLIENAIGGSGNDVITGNDAANTLTGNAGNDRIAGKGGADRIDGGEGTDTVVYDGVRADYVQDLQVDGSILLTKSNGDIDLLFGIERLDMADGDYVFDIGSDNVGFAYRIYGAAYGRTPDEGGLRYWTQVLDDLDANNPNVDKQDHLADQFLAATEFTALYGSNPSNEDYVDAMYQNVLKRLPDQAGYDFWVGAMDGGLGRDAILVSFSESIENRINADVDYDDGIWVV